MSCLLNQNLEVMKAFHTVVKHCQTFLKDYQGFTERILLMKEK